jgi:cytochrome c biogenesis protein CcdA
MNNRTVGIVLGVVLFVTGLLLHVLSYTKQIPSEKRNQVRISAIIMIIVGGTMAMLPYMMKIAQQSPP